MSETSQFLDMIRNLVEMANKTPIGDVVDLDQCIRSHDLVFGVWQDDTTPLGVGHSIIKGRGALECVKRTGTEWLAITAIRCRNAEEAEAMRQVYGDQPAQVIPLRDP